MKRRCAFLIAAVLFAGFAVPSWAGTYTLANGKLTLKFETQGSKVTLSSFRKAGNKAEWILPGAQGYSLCTLGLEKVEGRKIPTASMDTANAAELQVIPSSAKTEQGLSFIWKGIQAPGVEGDLDVTAKVTLPKGSELSYWTISFSSRLGGWGVAALNFPRALVIAGETSVLASPMGMGKLFRNPATFEKETAYRPYVLEKDMGGSYPSPLMTMQLMSLSQNGRSFYFSTHDPEGKGKMLHAFPNAEKTALEMAVEHFPDEPLKFPYDWTCPYPSVLGIVDGDWWHCCRVYRKWVIPNAEWERPPLGRAGSELPAWLIKTPVYDHAYYFEKPGLKEGGSLPYFQETQQRLGGVSTLPQYPYWRVQRFDVGYPDFFPALPWFAAEVKEGLTRSIHYLPYTNGLSADAGSDYWKNGGNKNVIENNLEKDNRQIKTGLVTMCPQSGWQQDIVDRLERVARELGVDGIYVDQVGCMAPYPCYAIDHSHPQGNRSNVGTAYRRMMLEARKATAKINPDIVWSTEDGPECYGFELPLMCNRTLTDMDAPMLAAVYADRIDPYGYMNSLDEYKKNVLSWRMKLVEQYVYGMLIGLTFTKPEDPQDPTWSLFRDLAQARVKASNYLSIGQMMHEPELSGENPTVSAGWQTYGVGEKMVTRTAVRATSWLAADGTAAIVFANTLEKTVTVGWKVDRKDLGLGSGALRISEFYPNETVVVKSIRKFVLSGSTTVPALGTRILVISPRKWFF